MENKFFWGVRNDTTKEFLRDHKNYLGYELPKKYVKNITEFSLRFQNTNLNSLFFNGDGEVKGFETLLQKKIDKYTGWISYTYIDAENIFPLLNYGNPFPAPNTQKNEFKVFNNYEINGWNFSLNFIYGSGKAFTEPSYNYSITLLDDSELNYIGVGPKNGSLLPDYHRLDLSCLLYTSDAADE